MSERRIESVRPCQRSSRSLTTPAATRWPTKRLSSQAVALAALVAGLIVAAILLAPWRLRFATDARELYRSLHDAPPGPGAASYLAGAGFAYQDLYASNVASTQRMSSLLAVLAILMVAQTLFWLTALVIG
jgi:hypothetical protein